MKRSEQDSLLKEILDGADIAALREASLQTGLASLRTRQKHRRALRISALVLPALMLAGFLLSRPTITIPETPTSVGSSAPRVAPVTGQVKFISDEELLRLFPGRPVALIGKPGEQQLVFLGTPEKIEPMDL
jgi:hypothetical protein